MTLEEVIKKALSDNADCLGGECDCAALGVAKAVRDFLLSDEVVEAMSKTHCNYFGGPGWWDSGLIADTIPEERNAMRAALSSITGDE